MAMQRSGPSFGRTLAAGVAVAALMAVSACGGGSSKPSSATSNTTTATTATTAPSTTASPSTSPSSSESSSPATSGASAPADPAAAEAQIKQNWQLFFDPKTAVADKEKYLQNGAVLAPLLQAFAADPRVGQVSSTVSSVSFTSPTTATVTYSLSLQGTVVEPNATGKAVLQDGTWKVADTTLCGLVALTGNTKLPGCS
ncbi:conserved hypothetical protein [Catenulispora acidiphila DSM 44928]|uniref:Low molecular weight antigen MTB12-like C-terminal domain-containing protein n=1 Tax=Catenulispora acidiphila (strain DSM 44928 / JCM 14897 / NBRC 102108 / NRRL B-24433 / ID139908) TaxID=479433 RepID=C7Q7R2_CATAD|nr:hypothetical protein [Catenulispora acidiphila]ACU72255.1 conserved hypothetical protein [Catenulispora acidiphila DSM 44928]